MKRHVLEQCLCIGKGELASSPEAKGRQGSGQIWVGNMGKKEKRKNLLGLQFGEGHEYIIKRENKTYYISSKLLF